MSTLGAAADGTGAPEKPKRGERAQSRNSTASKERLGKAELVEIVLENIEAKLKANELKPTIGDFIRLLQLEKELAEEQPREIKVSWVDRTEAEYATEK